MIEYKMLYLPQKKSDKIRFSCIAFDASFYFNIQAIRLILERVSENKINIRGSLHLQVDVHHDDDSIIDAYNEIETTVEGMKPATITVMDNEYKPILEIIGVVIVKLGSFGRAHFTAQSVRIIEAEEVKRFVIS
jgi:hypothetical protein